MKIYGIGENKSFFEITAALSDKSIQSAEGDEIIFTGLKSNIPIHFDGITKQVTTSGKQLFNKDGLLTNTLVQVTQTSDNAVTFTMKVDGDYPNVAVWAPNPVDLSGKTVFISCKFESSDITNAPGYIQFAWANAAGTMVGDYMEVGVIGAGGMSKTFTIPAMPDTATQFSIRVYLRNGPSVPAGVTCTFTDLMISVGNTVVPWEPYTGGKAAPNTDYPQPIWGLGQTGKVLITDTQGDDVREFECPFDYPLHAFNGIKDEFYRNDLGMYGWMKRFTVVEFDGSEDELWTAYDTGGDNKRVLTTLLKTLVKPPLADSKIANIKCDRYIAVSMSDISREIQGIAISTSGNLSIYDPEYNTGDITKWRGYLGQHPMTVVYELATPTWWQYISGHQAVLRSFRSFDGDNVIGTAKDGNAACATLHSAGSVSDEFTTQDGQFGIMRKVGMVALHGDASEEWVLERLSDTTKFRANSTATKALAARPATIDTLANVSCERYTTVTESNIANDMTEGIAIGTYGNLLVYDAANSQDLIVWKNLISIKPLRVYYELATPYFEPVTEFVQPNIKLDYATTPYGALLLDSAAGLGGGGIVADENNNLAVGTTVDFKNGGANNCVVGAGAKCPYNSLMNTVVGTDAMHNSNGTRNTALGYGALMGTTATLGDNSASRCVAVGLSAMRDAYQNSYCIYIGAYAGEQTSGGTNNVQIGSNAGKYLNADSTGNCSIGHNTMQVATSAKWNTGLGGSVFAALTTAEQNVAVGYNSLSKLTTGTGNVSMGSSCGGKVTTGSNNVLIGLWAGNNVTTGSWNTMVGGNSFSNATSQFNTGLGFNAGNKATTGSNNTFVGYAAGSKVTTGSYNTAIGHEAMLDNTTYSYCASVGMHSQVTGDNQIQLGGSGTTPYAYAALQVRSDARDKADIEDSDLGLNFIKRLRPVKYRWDLRDDYKNYNEDGDPVYATPDGSKKRKRYHYGLIAQEVKAAADNMGIDFSGYQDHSVNGGMDVLTLGYESFIAPMIKAIQELNEKVKALEYQLMTDEEKAAQDAIDAAAQMPKTKATCSKKKV
uniref:tail fiber domain-containing protein n=1 Tax=Eisenbergiella sp. TaxID=1924109 RepID=UPI003AB907C9